MTRRSSALLPILFSFLSIASLAATSQAPADNAALRYWMAFAQMNDTALSADDAAKMDAIVKGTASWDEQRFGPLVEQNKAAIETMIRGSRLPYCDWGIEYNLGPDAPLAYFPKARALARLNRLYAVRLVSSGDSAGATRATIAGMLFARHLAQNASLMGALTAKVALTTELDAVKELATGGTLSSSELLSLQSAVRALPVGGFDWSRAVHLEGGAMHSALLMLLRSRQPRGVYQEWFGNPAPSDFHLPSTQQRAELDRVMSFYEKLMAMPPDAARVQIPVLQKEIDKLDPVSRMLVPNPARMIAARADTIAAQHSASQALGLQ